MVASAAVDHTIDVETPEERFRREVDAFLRASDGSQRFSISWDDRVPCVDDRTAGCGFDRHYIYHTAWAARVLAGHRPARHLDISSSLYFCSIVSAFVPVEYYEYRPADLRLDNLNVASAD